MTHTRWGRAARLAVMALLCSSLFYQPVSAQDTTGTITGVVTDPSGAVLPGVTVTIKHAETGVSRDFVTNDAGVYIAALPVGKYAVTFTLQGFQSRTVSNIDLHVGDRLDIGAKLAVGAVTENVEVSAASQFVQPIPAVQNLMGPTQVQELPLNNRVFVQLATLVPGVTSDLPDEVGVGLTSVVSISVNGGRRNSVNWMVDGVSNVDVGSNVTLLSTPTLESIQEFKIITSSYAAEYARSGGGVINIVTKGGTSKFSGTGYEFYRDEKFNANSFFRNLSSNPDINSKPPALDYHNFGYTIGGPIVPWRDKAFFFWSQEWRRIERAPSSSTAFVPLPSWLTDPASPNYVAPALRDPNAVRLLDAYPAPNVEGTNRFINSNPSKNNTRQEVIRADIDLRRDWRLTARYTHDLSETREPGGLFFGVVVPNIATTDTAVPGQVAAAELRTVHGSRMNEVKYQFSSNRIGTTNPDGTRNKRNDYGLEIPELFSENNANRIPTVVISGVSTIGASQGFNIEYFNHTFVDNLTWQRGNHGLKFGVMAAFEQKNEGASNETQGRFSFVAGGGRTAFQNFLTGNRDGLCTACTYSESEIDITNNLRFNRYEMYAQDTWRLAPGLTVDYGVRYALYPGIVDKNDVLTNFDPALYDPSGAPTYANSAGSLVLRGTGNPLNGIVVAGQNSAHGRAIYPTDTNNIQPRVGFAWDPRNSGRMIVRGGYGIYYDQPLVGIFEQNAFVNPPFANTVVVLNPALSNPAGGVPPGTTGVRSLIASSDPFDSPRTQQWNIGMQRQLYSRGVIDVGYVGSRGDNLIQPVDINQPQPQDVIAQGGINVARPYDGYGTINMRQTTAYSRYHGLLTSFRHEHGRNGSVTLNYTLSRSQTTSTNDRDAVDMPQNPLDLDAEYADARTDRRHVFNANFIYELPFYRNSENQLAKAVIGGWQLSGIVNITSGPPVPRILTSNDGFRRGNQANQVADPLAGDLAFPYWFRPAAFAPPALGQYGTAGRAPFRLPGRHQWDLTISKNWYPGSLRFQVRADFINAFNQTQYVGVDAACNSGTALTMGTCAVGGTNTFGQITSTRAPREVQFGLKLYW